MSKEVSLRQHGFAVFHFFQCDPTRWIGLDLTDVCAYDMHDDVWRVCVELWQVISRRLLPVQQPLSAQQLYEWRSLSVHGEPHQCQFLLQLSTWQVALLDILAEDRYDSEKQHFLFYSLYF